MENKIGFKIQKIFSSSIMIIVAIITFLIGFFAIGKTVFFNLVINFSSELCFVKQDNIFLNVLFALLVLAVLYFLYKFVLPKINKKVLFIAMLIVTLSVSFWWVNYLRLEPISDQYMVNFCAQKLLDGDLASILDSGNYLSRNPHQLGFVLYLSAVFKIFNTRNLLFIQNLNVVFSAICVISMYLIVKEIFEEDIIHKISIFFIGFFALYFMFFSPHVYGNLPGLAFGLISLLFTLKYLNSGKYRNLVVVGITITLSYLLKNNYEIFLIAIIIELLLKSLKDLEFKTALCVLGIIVTVFGVKAIMYTGFKACTGYSLDNGVPVTSYIYMGIAEPDTLTPGWYTGDVEGIYNKSGYSKEKSKEMTKELMSDRLDYLVKNPSYTYGYFHSKLDTTWLNPTFQSIWCSTPGIVLEQDPDYNKYVAPKQLLISIVCGKAFSLEERAMDVFQILTFIGASFALFISFKEGSLNKMLLPIVFLGGFAFHFIWETKAIYVLQYFYMLIPFAVYGIYKLFLSIENKVKSAK